MNQKGRNPATIKAADELTENELLVRPVWKFINDDEIGELAVQPVRALPAKNLDGKVVGCPVTFSNGSTHFAMLGNVDSMSPPITREFLTISILKSCKWIHLSRYFDPDYKSNGPDAFAKNIGSGRKDIFPISYDLRRYSKGAFQSLVGEISENPKKRLSQKERIALAVP
jgi:hypothetical protein